MSLKKLLRPLKQTVLIYMLQTKTKTASPLNVILGAGQALYQGYFSINLKVLFGTTSSVYHGWFATDMSLLDITKPSDWQRLFRPDSIDRLLAEHVLEHLSEAENRIALQQSYRYLKPGGTFRIAIPDGYCRDENYIKKTHPPQDGHKTLFTIDTLKPLLEETGFHVTPVEFFDAAAQFHYSPWKPADGYVKRSFRIESQKKQKRSERCYTSLIVDARKL